MIDFDRAINASKKLKVATSEQKNAAIAAIAEKIKANYRIVEEANEKDLAAAEAAGVSKVMLDRLAFKKGA